MSLEAMSRAPDGPSTTPKTPGAALKTNGTSIVTPSQPSASYRLLYRGALSLPDSHLLLDGLTFTACLDSPSKRTKSYSLLENPLALALESMRGRPSLRFLGVVKLSSVYLDETGNVELDIHPRAVLSRIYFENTFCLKPFPSSSSSETRGLKSEVGIKVSLGDSDGPDTTQIIIYAQLKALPPSPTVRLCVARITLRPPTQKRLPRPDDPIPRKPPIIFARDLQRAESKGILALPLIKGAKVNELKRAASFSTTNGAKRPKLMGGGSAMNDVFKVPEVPMRQSKGKEKAQDVFGDVAEVPVAKSKQKASADDKNMDAVAVEKANKSDIKKITIDHLAQTKDPTQKNALIDKKHTEWKDLWGFVYRGVCFALRNRIKVETLDVAVVDRLVKMHIKLYLTGTGPPDSSAAR